MFGLISFDPIVELALGPLRVSPHGIGATVGFLAGARLFLPRTRRLGIPDDVVMSMLYWAALGALVGARLAYVANHLGDFNGITDVIAVWEGGISLLGGLAGGIVVAATVVRRQRLPLLALLDAAVPGISLGIAVGRIGDLIVGDHLGKPTGRHDGYVGPVANDVDYIGASCDAVGHRRLPRSAARLGPVILAVETTPGALSEVVSRVEGVGR